MNSEFILSLIINTPQWRLSSQKVCDSLYLLRRVCWLCYFDESNWAWCTTVIRNFKNVFCILSLTHIFITFNVDYDHTVLSLESSYLDKLQVEKNKNNLTFFHYWLPNGQNGHSLMHSTRYKVKFIYQFPARKTRFTFKHKKSK